jgi:hypothetical protein
VTHPSVDSAQSGDAADAVRTLQEELRNDYSEMRSAEIQLTEAILTAHAVTTSGRGRLQDIQRQLIEAINNPVTALDTPAGERQFLVFLRSKVGEIQDVVDAGALSDEDHARVTRALASGYLLTTAEGSQAPPVAPPVGAPMTDQAAGVVPALGSALGALPQMAQGAATAPAQGASGLAGAATPLAGLASGLLDRAGGQDHAGDRGEAESLPRETTDDDNREAEADHDDTDDADDEDTDDARSPAPVPPSDREPPERGPAQTRPAGSR